MNLCMQNQLKNKKIKRVQINHNKKQMIKTKEKNTIKKDDKEKKEVKKK